MATLRLDQNYISNVLIPDFAAVAFQTECSGNASYITSFSYAGGKSSYSFGIFQYDLKNNSSARDFLSAIGFTSGQIAELELPGTLSVVDQNALSSQLAIALQDPTNQEKLDALNASWEQGLANQVQSALAVINVWNPDVAKQIYGSEELQLRLMDYANQFGTIDLSGPLVKWLSGASTKMSSGQTLQLSFGQTLTAADIENFIMNTQQGVNYPNVEASRFNRLDTGITSLNLVNPTVDTTNGSLRAILSSVTNTTADAVILNALSSVVGVCSDTSGTLSVVKADPVNLSIVADGSQSDTWSAINGTSGSLVYDATTQSLNVLWSNDGGPDASGVVSGSINGSADKIETTTVYANGIRSSEWKSSDGSGGWSDLGSTGLPLSESIMYSDGSGRITNFDYVTGKLTADITHNVDGSGVIDRFSYDSSGNVYENISKYSADGASEITRIINNVLQSIEVYKADYSIITTNFDAAGQVSQITTVNADGTANYVTYFPDGSVSSSNSYQGTVRAQNEQVLQADGSISLISFYPSGSVSKQVTTNLDSSVYSVSYFSGGGTSGSLLIKADGSSIDKKYFASQPNHTSAGQLSSETDTSADGSIREVRYLANGSPSSDSLMQSDGSFSKTLFDAFGRKVSDQWAMADGTSGSDTFNSDGSGSGLSFNIDGGNTAYTFSADGSRIMTQHYLDGTSFVALSDAIGSLTSTYYDTSGQVISNAGWFGSSVMFCFGSGIKTYSIDSGNSINFGSGITYKNISLQQQGTDLLVRYSSTDSVLLRNAYGGISYFSLNFGFADGSRVAPYYGNDANGIGLIRFTQDGHGKVTEQFFDANGLLLNFYISTDDGLGNTTNTYYDAQGNKLHDSWRMQDGSGGENTYFPDGSRWSQLYDAGGNHTWTQYDVNGIKTSESWQKADGTLSISYTFNTDGSIANTTESIRNPDGTSSWSSNDGHGNTQSINFNSVGIKINDSWTKADGSYGSDVFNADGSSSGSTHSADGSYSSYTNGGNGDALTTNYNAAGIKISDSWSKSDGTFGSDIFNADGTYSNTLYDWSGGSSTINYDAVGIKLSDSWKKSDGSFGGDTFNADGSYSNFVGDASGNLATTNFDAAGIELSSSWTKSDGSYGNEHINPDGSYSGSNNNVDGSYYTFNRDASGKNLSALDYAVDGSWIGSHTTVSDGLGNINGVTYDTNGTKISDTWAKSDGSNGSDTFNADGSRIGTATLPTFVGEGIVMITTTTNYDSGGIKLNDSWTADNGTYGNDVFNSDGSSSGTSYWWAGYSSYVNDGRGDMTTTYYDLNSVKLNDNWTKADGSSGSDTYTYNPDGTSLQQWWKSDGTSGSISYDSSGLTTGDSLVNADGSQAVDAGGNHLLLGSAANDTLLPATGNDILIGGAGNDVLTTGTGSNLIAFSASDGQDIVNATSGVNNTLSLGGHFAFSDLALQKSGNDLILDVGTSDSITFKNWYAGAHNIVNLQVIESAMTDFNPGSTDILRNSNIENFDFQKLVAAFDQAQTANPSLNLNPWSVTNDLLTAHLSSSDTAALGGDLANIYGAQGSLTGFNIAAAQSTLSNTQFVTAPQTLSPWPTLNTGTARIG